MREKFTGIVKSLSAEQSGTSKSGNDWKRKDLLLYNADPEFSATVVVFTFLNERVKLLDEINLQTDDKVQVEYYLSADDYKGKWIPKVTALSVVKLKSKKEKGNMDALEQIILLIKDATYFSGFELEGDNPYYGIKKVYDRIVVLASKIDLSESDQKKIIADINLTIEVLNDEYREQYNEDEDIIPFIADRFKIQLDTKKLLDEIVENESVIKNATKSIEELNESKRLF
jgi:hypothetical protein